MIKSVTIDFRIEKSQIYQKIKYNNYENYINLTEK